MKVTRNDFRNQFIYLFEENFKIKTFWNGKESDKQGLKRLSQKHEGQCFTYLEIPKITLKFKVGMQFTMLTTLIHEYVHALIHKGDNTKYLCSEEKEIEAETVVLKVLKFLDIYNSPSMDYIETNRNRYKRKKNKQYIMPKEREIVVNTCVSQILDVIKIKECLVQQYAKDEMDFKKEKANKPKKTRKPRSSESKTYTICCSNHGILKKYKRKTKIVKAIQEKENAIGCVSCQKNKAKHRLFVKVFDL